jgi:putative chitinase
MSVPIAIKIMFYGMTKGTFTGKMLSDYFNEETEDWVNARKIINGLDKAELIAGYAKDFYIGLTKVAKPNIKIG